MVGTSAGEWEVPVRELTGGSIHVSKHGYICTRDTYVQSWECGCVYSAAASEGKRLSSSRGSQGHLCLTKP